MSGDVDAAAAHLLDLFSAETVIVREPAVVREMVAALVAEVEQLRAWKAARIENHPTDGEFYGR